MQFMNMNFQMSGLDLEKAEEEKIKFPTSVGSSEKQEFGENIYLLTYTKAFNCIQFTLVAQLCQPISRLS